MVSMHVTRAEGETVIEAQNNAAPGNGYNWQPITDLPENWHDLRREDLHAVHEQWMADRALIKDETKVKKFQEEIALRWAIETGIIERLYTVDRGVTVQILKAGMEALGQFHAKGRLSTDARALITDQREALEMVMDLVGGARVLTDSYIKELHQRLTLSQEKCEAEDQFGVSIQVPLLKGNWKKQSNNPRRPDGSIHEYCPPEFVQDEIDNLLSWHGEHHEVYPEIEAAWLHHRFSQIHPFQDGNGRVARALTGAVFLRAGYLVLVIRDEEHREQYIDALEYADHGELKPLVDLFTEIQIGDLNEAIKSVRELRGATIVGVSETLAARAKRREMDSQILVSKSIDRLIQVSGIRLEEAKAELERAFEQEGVRVDVHYVNDDPDRQDWWSWQIIESAQEHNYYAELSKPRRWGALLLRLPDFEQEAARLVISLHAVGRAVDLYAATAFLTSPVGGGDNTHTNRWQNETISELPFRFGARTSKLEGIEERFRAWLDTVIENGLSVWGERL